MESFAKKYLTVAELRARWGVSTMFLDRRLKDDDAFPKPEKIGPNIWSHRKWLLSEIEEYEKVCATRDRKPGKRRASEARP
jgi:predicted DNA-binding transcriptional regulator AlpA